ncbi:MAG: hypothetical protein HZB65_02665 [Candidatus Aenigmarchaeota archaeon]|nr:hypothetical protein [Candidatus Aenigmarchaeota archaeon]
MICIVTKLVIPENYSEEIRIEGIRESGKRRNFPRPGKETNSQIKF